MDVIFDDLTGGVQNRHESPLAYPQNAMVDGQNIDILPKGFRVRHGATVVSSGSLPVGTVKMLEQVRFPTLQQKYLLAQIDIKSTAIYLGLAGFGKRADHSATLDADRDRVLVFGGVFGDEITTTYYNDLWQYCMRGNGWSEITEYSGTPPSPRFGHAAATDGNATYIFGGSTETGTSNELFVYWHETNTWEQLTVSGTIPAPRKWSKMVYDLENDRLILWGGRKNTGAWDYEGPFIFDIATNIWSKLTPDYGPAGRDRHVMELIDGILYIAGGMHEGILKDCWKYSFSGNAWTQCADMAIDGEDAGLRSSASVVYDGKLVVLGGSQFTFVPDFGATHQVYDPVTNSWSTGATLGLPPDPRFAHTATLLPSEWILVVAGQFTDSPPVYREDMWLVRPTTNAPDNCALYASKTPLPSASIEFERIYDFGNDAGVCSVAVLGDRAIITEGVSDAPLVWSGCMEDDGSDWAYPITCLLSKDGTYYADVTDALVDGDPTTTLDVGGMRGRGELAIRTEVPDVSAFYVEMATPNTSSSVATLTGTRVVDFPEVDTVVRHDLRNSITNWVQDSESTGHFTDGTNPVTLGPGNSAPYVEVGCFATINGTDYRIMNIVGNGSGTGGVTLSASVASAACSEIFTLDTAEDDSSISIKADLGSASTVYSKTLQPEDWTDLRRSSIRIIVPNSAISSDGKMVRITLKAAKPYYYYKTRKLTLMSTNYWCKWNGPGAPPEPPLRYSHTGYYEDGYWSNCSANKPNPATGATILTYAAENAIKYETEKIYFFEPFTIESVTIVERSGSTANGTTTPSPITFNGQKSVTITSPEQTITSDFVAYEIDKTGGKSYLICLDILYDANDGAYLPASGTQTNGDIVTYLGPTATTSTDRRRGATLAIGIGDGVYWHVRNNTNSTIKYSMLQNVTEHHSNEKMGFALKQNATWGLTKIEVKDMGTLPTLFSVGHTGEALRMAVDGLSSIVQIIVDRVVPSGCQIYHAFSFDDRTTWKIIGRDIVRLSGSQWQYNTSSTSTPVWTNPPINSRLSALQEAFAISYNQMNAITMASADSMDWEDAGFEAGTTQYVDFAFALKGTKPNVPRLSGYRLGYNQVSVTGIKYFTGTGWSSGSGWQDNTKVGSAPLGQSGTIEYLSCCPPHCAYGTLSDIPGYWWRLILPYTSSGAKMSAIRYKAPCQRLQSIGSGLPTPVLAFVVQDKTTGNLTDYSVAVSDYTHTAASSAPLNLSTDDALYICGYPRFIEIDLTPGTSNTASANLLVTCWDGIQWVAVKIVDATINGDSTLAKRGKISFALPETWQQSVALAGYPMGYWVKIRVTNALSSGTTITECRLTTVPDALVKHEQVVIHEGRVCLVGRPNRRDQIDLSGMNTEYDWTSIDSASYQIGGGDRIQAVTSAWGGLLLAKCTTWHQFTGDATTNFQMISVEASRHTPINTNVIVKAPISGFQDGARYGLYYINHEGCWLIAGIGSDNEQGTARYVWGSSAVNWWSENADIIPRLDKQYLYQAIGVYWPERNWVMWSVPMLVTPGQTSQTECNRIIIYDVTLQAWLPPINLRAASLCLAYTHNSNAPGHIGRPILLAGDYDGRIWELFSPDATSDNGAAISGWFETGWLDFGQPLIEKRIRPIHVIGETSADLTISVYRDGEENPSAEYTVTGLSSLTGKAFGKQFHGGNVTGSFLKYKLQTTAPATIHGIIWTVEPVRDRGGQ